MSSIAVDYNILTVDVDKEVIPTYHADSILSLFAGSTIKKGIAASKWAKKYLLDTKAAAWTKAGFNPNFITMAFQGFELQIDTFSQSMTLDEKDMAFYSQEGIFDVNIGKMGNNLAKSTNSAFIMGLDENEDSPHSTQYNFLLDEGSGNGTGVRPIMASNNASAGGWSTFANADKDIANLIGGMVAMGYKKEQIVVLYPKVAEPVMMSHLTEQQGLSIRDWIKAQCMDVIPIENAFFKTDVFGGTPTAPALTDFDLLAVSVSDIVIGYAREERVRVIPPYGTVRATTVEAEVWPCPLMIPTPYKDGTTQKYIKGVGMLDGAKQTA